MALFTYPPVAVSIPGVATEATLLLVLAEVESIDAKQDDVIAELEILNATDFATETEQEAQTALLTTIEGNQDAQTALLTTIDVDTGNIATSTASIDTKTPALVSGRVPVDVQTSALPTGAATSAGQSAQITEAQATNTKLDTLNAKDFATQTTLAALSAKIVQLALNYGAATGALRTIAQIGTPSGPAAYDAGQSDPLTLRVVASNDSNPKRGYNPEITYRQDLSSSPISTTYVEIIASTSAAVNLIDVFWPSGVPLWIGVGSAGLEDVLVYVPPGGGRFPVLALNGSRIAVRAETGSVSSGYLVFTAFN